jgi:Tfp pilus assembly PilM family ATPase
VERHLELLRTAGLYPVVLDVGVLAIGNLYTSIEDIPSAAAPVCIVNLGRRTADIAILYHDGFIYPRVVFSPAADWQMVADQLAGHVQDMMKYSEFKLRRDPVKRVMLCGSVPEEDSFRRGVSDGVGLPCEVWNPLAKLVPGLRVNRLLSGKEAGRGPALAACLGLALRSA